MISFLVFVGPLVDLILLRLRIIQNIIKIFQTFLAEIFRAQLGVPASLARPHHVDPAPGSRSLGAKIP